MVLSDLDEGVGVVGGHEVIKHSERSPDRSEMERCFGMGLENRDSDSSDILEFLVEGGDFFIKIEPIPFIEEHVSWFFMVLELADD